jgi:FAD/FMN-containing dehydrogenase
MLANNAAGALSYRYGSVRDWVEALDVVLSDGSIRRFERSAAVSLDAAFSGLHRGLVRDLGAARPTAWPAVRKNSSGYALDRFLPSGDPVDLLVGSEGTLGFIVGARLRLAPLPPKEVVALLALPTRDAFPAVLARAEEAKAAAVEFFGARFLDVSGLRHSPETSGIAGSASALMLIGLGGEEELVSDGLDVLLELASDLGTPLVAAKTADERARFWGLRHAASPAIAACAEDGLVSMQFIEDSVLPPARLGEYLEVLQEILRSEEMDAVVFGHAGDANVHVNPLVDVRTSDWREKARRILEQTVDEVARLGGTLSGEHGDGRVRAPFLQRMWGADLARSFGRVKDVLDPHGIFNPGVVIPLPSQDPLEGIWAGARDS